MTTSCLSPFCRKLLLEKKSLLLKCEMSGETARRAEELKKKCVRKERK